MITAVQIISVWWISSITEFFCQICRQIIVLTPRWYIQGFVNTRVSDAMQIHNETWTENEMNAYHLVLLFFFYQIKLVFSHKLIKIPLTRQEIKLKGMPEKPKHCWSEIWNHHFRKLNFFQNFMFAFEIQTTEVRFENMLKNMRFHGLNCGI